MDSDESSLVCYFGHLLPSHLVVARAHSIASRFRPECSGYEVASLVLTENTRTSHRARKDGGNERERERKELLGLDCGRILGV